jgi:hypothetical protein
MWCFLELDIKAKRLSVKIIIEYILVTFNLANYVVRPGLNGHWATTF